MKPHKHLALIKAWADGAIIESKYLNNKWVAISNPGWYDGNEYRLKLEIHEDGTPFSVIEKEKINKTEMKPHKYAEAIKAWANGAAIEYKARPTNEWTRTPSPNWHPDVEYRVAEMKPHKHASIIQAWADGATIEYKHAKDAWAVVENPEWFPDTEYRVKPEPKYRPYTNEELKGLVGKAINKGSGRYLVVGAFGDRVKIGNSNMCSAIDLLMDCTHEDGSTCGVLEE